VSAYGHGDVSFGVAAVAEATLVKSSTRFAGVDAMVFEREGKGGAKSLPFNGESLTAETLPLSPFVSRDATLDPIEFSLTPNAAPASPVGCSESCEPSAVRDPVVADLASPAYDFVKGDERAAGELVVLDGRGNGWLFLVMAGNAENSAGLCRTATGLNRTGPEPPIGSTDLSKTVAGDMVDVPLPDPTRAGSLGGVDAEKSACDVLGGVPVLSTGLEFLDVLADRGLEKVVSLGAGAVAPCPGLVAFVPMPPAVEPDLIAELTGLPVEVRGGSAGLAVEDSGDRAVTSEVIRCEGSLTDGRGGSRAGCDVAGEPKPCWLAMERLAIRSRTDSAGPGELTSLGLLV